MTQTVDALVTTGPKEPFERTTVERRDPRAARRADRHQVRRHLPLRHPPGPRGVGRGHLPDGPRPRDRRRRLARSAPSVTKYAVGDRVGVGCLVDSCRECENCQAGLEQYCLKGEVPTYNGDGIRRRAHLRRLLAARSSSTRTTSLAHPRGPRPRRGRAAAVRGHHPLLAAEALGRRPRQEGRHRRHGRPRPHGRQDRARARRRGDRAQPVAAQAGRRPEAGRRPLLRHQRPGRPSRSCAAPST